jgi:hypothetical protein
MAIRDGERHKAYLGPPLCTEEQHAAAHQTIITLAANGLLKPIEGISTDSVDKLIETYADILGIKRPRT